MRVGVRLKRSLVLLKFYMIEVLVYWPLLITGVSLTADTSVIVMQVSWCSMGAPMQLSQAVSVLSMKEYTEVMARLSTLLNTWQCLNDTPVAAPAFMASMALLFIADRWSMID